MKLKRKAVKWIIGILSMILIIIGLIFAVPGIYRFALYLLRLFMPFVLGYIFALMVDPLVRKLQRHLKIPRKIGALLVIVLLIGVVGGGIIWAVYKIINELRSMYDQIPTIYTNIMDKVEIVKAKMGGIYEILPPNVQKALLEMGTRFSELAADFINDKSVPIVAGAGSFAKSVPSGFVSVVVFLLSSFFIACDIDRVKTCVKKIFRIKNTDKLARVAAEIKKYLGAYIKAQGTIMLIAFCILFLGLSILKVPYAVIIALGTALLDALPFFGSGAVLLPWTLVNFVTSNTKLGIGTLLIYVVIVVTRQFIEPKIVSNNIGISPILTLMSMYLGFRIFSIGGMILGPLVMMLLISLYRAQVFDVPVAMVKAVLNKVKRQLVGIKNKIIDFWESE